MMSKLTTQQKWILAIAGVVLINVAVWMYGLSPALDRIQALDEEYSRVEQQKRNLETNLARIDALDVDALQEEFTLLNTALPELGLLREFLIDLEVTAGEMGVQLGTVSGLSQAEVEPYLVMDIRLALTGTYPNLFSFIEYLEEHPRLLLLQSFTFNAGEPDMSSAVSLRIFAEDFDEHTPFDAPGRQNPFRSR